MALGSGISSACGGGEEGGGRPPASAQPRDDEIRATLDAVWAATGLAHDQVRVAEYEYTFEPDNTGCAGLAYDDRWFGGRGSSGTVTGSSQAGLEASVVGYLEGEGFAVTPYRSTHPDSHARLVLATRDEVTVRMLTNADSYATIIVRSGPCAPGFNDFDPRLYEPDA